MVIFNAVMTDIGIVALDIHTDTISLDIDLIVVSIDIIANRHSADNIIKHYIIVEHLTA